MSAGPSLYRRHRPRTFADVVGQEHVVRTLRNAIELDKVHHAYLFVGSRGTGKTSMAKILAACLNCEKGRTIEPCGACDSCVSIANASSLDVIEMDAASNNSVDDIRDLRERVAYAPVSGRHKVYILDEAHMLSAQAWNAFLKTLEEPPPNTLFVLATTEANKVLPTVADRCHRFDFARPAATDVATVLRRTAKLEGIDLPEPACALLARQSKGSFRDALGNLEQVMTYGGNPIAVESVLAVLGVADADLLFGTIDAIVAADVPAVLRHVAGLAEHGRDPGRFFSDLEAHTRDLLVVGGIGEVPLELQVTPDLDARLQAQAAAAGTATVVRLLDLIAQGMASMKNGADARVALELALTKAADPDIDPSTQALLARIERLENKGPAPEPVVRAPAPPVAPPARDLAVAPALAPEPAAAPEPAPEPAPAPAPPAPEASAPPDIDAVRSLWPAVLDTVQSSNAMLAALLQAANPSQLRGDELTIAFPESQSFSKRKAEDAAHRNLVSDALQMLCGARLTLAYELAPAGADAAIAPPVLVPDLTGEELAERFVAEFDAHEITPDDGKDGA